LQYKITQKLVGHTGPITALEAAYVPSTGELKQGAQLSAVIVTASVDSSVKIWRRTNEEGTFLVFYSITFSHLGLKTCMWILKLKWHWVFLQNFIFGS